MMHIIPGAGGACYDGDNFARGERHMSPEAATVQCLNCARTVEQVPLLTLTHRQGTAYICPQCLPVLIHQPQQLLNRLPGAEALQPHEH
jgi:hypothetical protein